MLRKYFTDKYLQKRKLWKHFFEGSRWYIEEKIQLYINKIILIILPKQYENTHSAYVWGRIDSGESETFTIIWNLIQKISWKFDP